MFVRSHPLGQPIAADDGVEVVGGVSLPATGWVRQVVGDGETQDGEASESIDDSEIWTHGGTPGQVDEGRAGRG